MKRTPGEESLRLQALAGEWAGAEQFAAARWSPGGPATARLSARMMQGGYYWLALFFLAWVSLAQADMPAMARGTKAIQDMAALAAALDLFHHDKNRYPTTQEGLSVLAADGYIQHVPKDPWGNPYHYLQPGLRSREGYDLWSHGADGQPGGKGENADIGNWPGSVESYTRTMKRFGWEAGLAVGIPMGIGLGSVFGLPFYVAGTLIRRRLIQRPRWAALGADLQLLAGVILALTVLVAVFVGPGLT